MKNFGIFVILPLLSDFVDELHEIPISVAIILLVEFCVLLLLELLGIRDEKLSRNTLR